MRDAESNSSADGYVLIENSAPLLPHGAWKISAEPAVVIGALDSDTTRNLHEVQGAVRLSDGRVVVANGPAPMLRWFDAKGVFLHGTGRAGGGPGEFTGGEGAWIAALWLLPRDSIATWEHQLRRMQVFDPSGKYVRAMSIPRPDSTPRGTYPNGTGTLAGGLFITLPPYGGDVKRTDPDSIIYLWYHPAHGYRQLATRHGPKKFMMRRYEGSETYTEARPPMYAPGHAARTDDDHLYYAYGGRFEIEVIDTTGTVVRRIRANVPERKVNDAVKERLRQDALAQAKNANERVEMERNFNSLRFAETFPYIRRLRIDRLDHIWAQPYNPIGSTNDDWQVFDAAGKWITMVTLPSRLQIYEIGQDWILGLMEDELGVERVVVYDLIRTASAGR